MNSPSDAEQSQIGSDAAHWRADITSLVFPLPEHGAICAVHRGAFRTLLGTDPTPEACIGYFARYESAFRAAAGAKIVRKRIPPGTNLHLTSRDIARKLLEADQIERGERP
ncbi:hypothetical protein [Bradyrhizobium sp. CCBAU 53421]|uniref:hypothetical protein n=1 Tax=Bradyrhizobium sp. CCBAU 53421 TaxID=1325120 RepID=UPI00188A0E03|nr:hypothetical protein [Bradyrhizobium sp. CCBAU 53421]QOZ35283.1 hypothetical protein XH92_29350 [Bradyrhizobium sp. CCBAU 53421]